VNAVPAIGTDERARRLIRDLLDVNPAAAIAVVDVAKNLGDAQELLARSGIDIGMHRALRGSVAAGFVAPSDAGTVSEAIVDARADGIGSRAVHLRDGREGTLHMVRVDEPHLTTGWVMVIVPDSAGTFGEEPAPIGEIAVRVGVLHADGSGAITRAEDSVLSVLGCLRAALDGRPLIGIVHPDDQATAIAFWIAAKDQRGVAQRWRCRVARGDGSFVWCEVTLTNRIDGDGDGDVYGELVDISREVAAGEALATERSLLKQLTEALPVGVAKFDAEGRIEYANARLTSLLGRDPAAVIAAAIAGAVPRLAEAFSQLLREGRSSRFVIERDREELDRDLEWTLRSVTSEAGTITGGVLCVADVTEATELRAALEERATTDALTGCFNWAGTINSLQTALRSAGPGAGVGVLFIDLDGFKGINDGHGHAVGDRVLEIVARRLRNVVRPLDEIGRLGGDEFVVIAPGLPSLVATRAFAVRVSDEVNGVAVLADVRIEISASIGVAWADSGDADDVLADADRAMYTAKHSTSVTTHG
jgi:diguanylate cyclase (GGDEF)-like protein/PAS domain S-box-containing protein